MFRRARRRVLYFLGGYRESLERVEIAVEIVVSCACLVLANVRARCLLGGRLCGYLSSIRAVVVSKLLL